MRTILKALGVLAALVLCGHSSAQKYKIYPIPQQMQQGTETVSFTSVVDVVCESGIDAFTRNRLEGILVEHGMTANFTDAATAGRSAIWLGINGSKGKADLLATERGLNRTVLTMSGKYDRHILSLSRQNGQAELIIVGEHTDAVFFALASFEQMLDNGTTALPAVNIYDYADQKSRGLVEGYYGYPYSVSVKKDLLRFMMRYKMNTYLYGAKSDPYHSEKWKDAYPTSITAQQESNGWLSQRMIKEIAQESQETKVNFIWAIHPGGNFISSSSVVNDIVGKFQKMHGLGVRQFGIFVDDVGLPSADKYELNATRLTQVQQRLEALYNTSDAVPADTVKPLHFVPQAYAAGFVNDTQREGFFKALAATPAYITIYTTGWGVWSIPNSSDLNAIAKFLGRDVAWWWNYPCNDNADGQIYTMDMYSNFYDLTSVSNDGTLPKQLNHGAGIVSNPMQEGELSKIALFSVADYAWNTDAFNVTNSWQAAVRAVVGDEAYDDYIFLADYLRYNDPPSFSTLMATVKSKLTSGNLDASALEEQLQKIDKACDTFIAFKTSEREADRLFYKDIEPWLLKLKQMAKACSDLLAAAKMDNADEGKWEQYVKALHSLDDLSTNEAYIAYALEGMGSGISVSQRVCQPSERYFKPFLAYVKEHVMDKYFTANSSDKLTVITNATVDNSLRARNTSGYYTMTSSSSVTLKPGEFVGLMLPSAILLDQLMADESLTAVTTVRYSANGKDWSTFSADEGTPTSYVKYIVFLNETSTDQTVSPTFTHFRAVPATPPTITSLTVPSGGDASGTSPSNLTDGSYSTWYSINRNQADGDAYTLTLADTTVIRDVRVCVGTVNGDYMNGGRVEVSLNGKTWTPLKVKGSANTTLTMNLNQVVTYSSEMKYCDFDGADTKARYVRFRITSANTSKWLRLFEIEVNKHSGTMPLAVNNKGFEISEVTDRTAYTSLLDEGKYFYYRFLQMHPLRSVTVYQDGAVASDAEVYVTIDGKEWIKVSSLTGYVCKIDLTGYPDARQLRINWNSKAPVIYEIFEETDDSADFVTTGILQTREEVRTMDARNVKSMEVFSIDGQCLYSGLFNPLSQWNTSPNKVLIIKYLMNDGQKVVRRLAVR